MHGASTDAAVAVRGLSYSFGESTTRVEVLHDLDLTLHRGELVVLMGPSGSGKTTLLTLMGCLRSVEEGSIRLFGTELRGASERLLIEQRRRLGFIFQAHNLHESLTAAENVSMSLALHNVSRKQAREASVRALELVGLGDRTNFLPQQLSGGQKQRVAVARAVAANPQIMFADEPTAALDGESGRTVVELLRQLADERDTTTLMVTHDHRVLDLADRIVKMEEGRIVDRDAEVALG